MSHQFKLDGSIVPKARPRTNKKTGRIFTQSSYRDWKDEAIAQLRSQSPPLMLEGVKVDVILKGKHSRRGDADNIIGSILDSLVQSGLLKNDNLVCVHGISVTLEHGQDSPTTVINIS